MAEPRGLEALGKLIPTSFVVLLAAMRFDPADQPPLMVGDEITVEVVARVVSAELGEKFNARSGVFSGALKYTAKAAPVDVGITAHRPRAEIEREFTKRILRGADLS